jgi:hypothetical protein
MSMTYVQSMTSAPEVTMTPINGRQFLLRCGDALFHAVRYRDGLRGYLFLGDAPKRRIDVRPLSPEQIEPEAHRIVRQGWAMLAVARRRGVRVDDLVVVVGDPTTTFVEEEEEVEA